jgi:hypothetical protein
VTPGSSDGDGGPLIAAAWGSTAVLVVALVLGVLQPDGAGAAVATAVSLGLFAAGALAFLWAYAVAIGRSRTVDLAVANTFLLLGSAPRRVQWHFYGALGVQIVASVAAASARPFTAVAFGILAPLSILGLMAQWGVRYGQFSPR